MPELRKSTPEEMDALQSDMELDLESYYRQMKADLLAALDEHSEKSVTDIIHEIGKKINGGQS